MLEMENIFMFVPSSPRETLEIAKTFYVKGRGRKLGGCAQKAVRLTPGDLGRGLEGT